MAVTDDHAQCGDTEFTNNVAELSSLYGPGYFDKRPGLEYGFIFHSIVAPTGSSCGNSEQEYNKLSTRTGGAIHDICDTKWDPAFSRIAQSIKQKVAPSCTQPVKLPSQPVQSLTTFTTTYVAENGVSTPLTRLTGQCNSQAGSGSGTSGYTFDPQKNEVTLCGPVCDSIGNGKIQYGFETICNVDCVFTWGDWGECDDNEKRRRSPNIIQNALGTGKKCEDEVKDCAHCKVGDWSEYSRCVLGDKTRTRGVLQLPSFGGRPCPPLEESKPCDYNEEVCYSSCGLAGTKTKMVPQMISPLAVWDLRSPHRAKVWH